MHISALFLTHLPQHSPAVILGLEKIQGVELQLQEESKIILTLEAQDEKEAEFKVKELEQIPHVLSVQLTGFFVES